MSECNLQNQDISESDHKVRLRNSLLDVLQEIANPPDFANVSVDTGMGFICDVECVFDAIGKPLPMTDISLFCGDDKELPEKAQRFGFL